MTTEELQKILQTEGYIAHVDDDGDLTFKAQGRTVALTREPGHLDRDEVFAVE